MRTVAMTILMLAFSIVVAGDRENAVPFTEEEATAHAELFCSRSGLLEIPVETDKSLQLCGSSYDHALVRLEDIVDLFTRMNSEALRDGWVFFGPTHGKTVVFKLHRNAQGAYEAPPVAFVPQKTDPPLEEGADAVRRWLAEQPPVIQSKVSALEGAIISAGPVDQG